MEIELIERFNVLYINQSPGVKLVRSALKKQVEDQCQKKIQLEARMKEEQLVLE